jgi:hypothetical protein
MAVPYLQQPATCPVRAWRAWQEAAGLESGPAWPTQTATPATPPAAASRPSWLAMAPATWRSLAALGDGADDGDPARAAAV